MGRYMFSLHKNISKLTKPFKKSIWVSATKVSNYLLKDPVIDWLNIYYSKNGLNVNRRLRKHKRNPSFSQLPLFKNGNLFENLVYENLSNKFGGDFIKASGGIEDSDFKKTLELIDKRIPIIAQAFIKSEKLGLRGIADLLVRSDFINKITKIPVLTEDEIGMFYVVVDIKWSNMELCVDGKTIRNTGRFKAYKGQLLVYSTIMEEIQQIPFPKAYILSKSWSIDRKKHGYSCFDRLGVVDFKTSDYAYVERTADAINWVRNVSENGDGWSPLYPHIKEMCCNACNQDVQWDGVKTQIMKETKDITQVWNVTPEQRNTAFDKGVKKWDDKRCTPSVLGITGKITGDVISNILKVNKKSFKEGNVLIDKKVYWEKNPEYKDFFIDYETISEDLSELGDMNLYNNKTRGVFLFMIGVGYLDDNDNFSYKNFTCESLTNPEEKRIVIDFQTFVYGFGKKCRFFHWGHVEHTILNNVINLHSLQWNLTDIVFVDMLKALVNARFAVKGALNFKLKEVARALYSNGYITVTWKKDDHVIDGISAMSASINYYKKCIGTLDETIQYNKTDCEVLFEIVKFLNGLNVSSQPNKLCM